jgi:hypothetical protein
MGMQWMMNWWVLVHRKSSSFVTENFISFVAFSAMGQKDQS